MEDVMMVKGFNVYLLCIWKKNICEIGNINTIKRATLIRSLLAAAGFLF